VVIIWSHPAREDLRLIHQHIAHDSKQYAIRVVNDIMERMEILPTAGMLAIKSRQDLADMEIGKRQNLHTGISVAPTPK